MASSYPGGLDSFNTAHIAGETIVAATDNDQADAINKIEAELGTNPSGSASTVASRIQVIDETINVDQAAYGGVIQTAIDAAATASKGRVYIPAGVRTLPATGLDVSSLQDELLIFGEGKKTELRMPNTAGLIGIDIAGEKVTVRDLYVKGSTAGGGGSESHAIRFQAGAWNGKLEDVYITDAGDDGIHIVATCLAVEIVRPWVVDCGGRGITVLAGANATRILGGWIQSNAGSGIYADRNELLQVEGVAMEVNGTNGTATANLELFESKYPVIRGNYFEDGQDYDLLYDDVSGFAVDGTIADNVFQFDSTLTDINVYLKRCYRAEMINNKFSSSLSGTTNLKCDTNTWKLKLRKHDFPGTVTFQHPSNTEIAENMTLSTPSAATLELPGSPFVTVTGSTNITTGMSGTPGMRMLFFSGTPTITDNNTTMRLNGSFTPTTADESLTVFFDGSTAFEVTRNPNLASTAVRPPVRVASTGNVTLTAPGATIDGVTMASGDRMLLKDQTTASQNGLYVWNGAASTATRATDADTAAKITDTLQVTVDEGTLNADTVWTLQTAKPITLGTTSLRFLRLSPPYNFATRDPWSHGGNAIAATMDRNDIQNSIAQTAITAICSFHGGMVVPAGRLITNINAFCTAAGAGAVTTFWWALVRQSDRVVLQRTANSTTLPTVDAVHTRALQATITLDYDTPCYIALGTQVATTSPSFAGVTGLATSNFAAPILTGNSSTSPTSTPPTVGAVLGAPAAGNTGRIHAWLS